MQTVAFKIDTHTLTALKAASNKAGVKFPQFVRECLFLSLIHLDLSTPGTVRFRTKSASSTPMSVVR